METREDELNEEITSDNSNDEIIESNDETIQENDESTEETTEDGTETNEEGTEETSENGTIEYIVSVDSNNQFNTPINDLPFSSVILVIGIFVLALTLIGGFKHE